MTVTDTFAALKYGFIPSHTLSWIHLDGTEYHVPVKIHSSEDTQWFKESPFDHAKYQKFWGEYHPSVVIIPRYDGSTSEIVVMLPQDRELFNKHFMDAEIEEMEYGPYDLMIDSILQ